MSRTTTKAREGRFHRLAKTRGSMLVKSRRRDPRAEAFGPYGLAGDSRGNRVGRYGGQAAVSGFAKGEGMTLDEIERELS